MQSEAQDRSRALSLSGHAPPASYSLRKVILRDAFYTPTHMHTYRFRCCGVALATSRTVG